MSGFHTATLCSDCDPPVVAISTGHGSRCPRCGQVNEGEERPRAVFPDGALARRVLRNTAMRSDGDARLLAELARRLLDRVGKERVKELEEELSELRDLADLVSAADIRALPPELLKVRQRWYAETQCEDRSQRRPEQRRPVTYVDLRADGKAVSQAGAPSPGVCPHCVAGEQSVWDSVLFHYAHPDGEKLKICHFPWRERCRRCSADVADRDVFCVDHVALALNEGP